MNRVMIITEHSHVRYIIDMIRFIDLNGFIESIMQFYATVDNFIVVCSRFFAKQSQNFYIQYVSQLRQLCAIK